MKKKTAEIKIAIVNAIYGGNKGAEAMLLALIDNLKNNYENIVIYNEIEERSDDIMEVIETFKTEFSDEKCKIYLYKFTPRETFKNILLGYYSGSEKVNADFVIDIGGLSFHDASPRGSLRTYLKHLPFIVRRTKRIFFTQDFGPIKTKFNKCFALGTLKNAHSIFTRSEKSKQALIKNLKLSEKKIYGPFPDSTITLNPENYIEQEIDRLKPFFLISPSIVMYNKYGDKYIEYFNNLIAYIKMILK